MAEIPISIITPVLNGEEYIETCLRSVIDQKYGNVEHIIVDGGSQDRTVEIVERFKEDFSHIRVYVKEGQDQSSSMNFAVEQSRNSMISFLNVDDFYQPGVFKRAAHIFKDLPKPAFLYANCNVLTDKFELIRVQRPSDQITFERLLCGFFVCPHPVNPSAYFYDKDLHRLAGQYRPGLHFAMDLDFIIRASRFAHFKKMEEIWGNFVGTPNSKTFKADREGKIYAIDKGILGGYWPELSLIKRLRCQAYYEYHRNPWIIKLKLRIARIFLKLKRLLSFKSTHVASK